MKKGNKNIDRLYNEKLNNFRAEPPREVWHEVLRRLIISRKLKDFKADPPPDVWDEVIHALDEGKRRNRMVVFMRVAAVISLLTALTITGLLVRDASVPVQVAVEQEQSDDVLPQEERNVADDNRGDGSGYIPDKEEVVVPVEHEEIIHRDVYLADQSEETAQDEVVVETMKLKEDKTETEWLGYLVNRYISTISGDFGTVSGKSLKKSKRKSPRTPGFEQSAQDEYLADNMLDEDLSSGTRWGVGTNATPLYSYRNLGVSDAAQPMAISNSYYDNIESGTLTYAGGVHVNYTPAKRLSFQSGLYYSKMGINVDHNYYETNLASAQDVSNLRLKYSTLRNTTGIINTTGDGEADYTMVSNESRDRSPQKSQIKINELNATIYEGDIIQNFEYLEIPMLIRYRLIDRKIGFNVLGGVSTNLLVGSDAFYSENNSKEKIGTTTNLKPVNYSSIIGLGLDYAITEKLFINLEPTFRYYLNSVNESGLKSYPYSMGIFTGLSYYF